MKITQGQKAILLTCQHDGLTNMDRINKVLAKYRSPIRTLIRRGWLTDSSKDHGKGCYALTNKGSDVLKELLGREPVYDSAPE